MELDAPVPGAAQRRKWLLTTVLLGITPALLCLELIVIAVTTGGFAGDFRMELYPEAKLVLHGISPFPPADAPFGYYNLIWPVPAALAVSPLTLLPTAAATAVFSLALTSCLVLALWLLDVRDWRVYAFVGLWPATLSGLQAGNITSLLALLLAVAWRYRNRRLLAGVAVGACVALKIFLWPMIVWLLATRRWAAAFAAATLSCLVFVSVLPFVTIGEYGRLMSHVSDAFAPQGFGPIGLAAQSGAPLRVAQAVGYALGLATLLLAWWRRSFVVALAASFLCSPVVWLHYFTLLVVPIAISSTSLDWLWLAPLSMWCATRATHGSVAWQTGVALATLAVVTVAAQMRSGERFWPSSLPAGGTRHRLS
jgi:hypothetical protein